MHICVDNMVKTCASFVAGIITGWVGHPTAHSCLHLQFIAVFVHLTYSYMHLFFCHIIIKCLKWPVSVKCIVMCNEARKLQKHAKNLSSPGHCFKFHDLVVDKRGLWPLIATWFCQWNEFDQSWLLRKEVPIKKTIIAPASNWKTYLISWQRCQRLNRSVSEQSSDVGVQSWDLLNSSIGVEANYFVTISRVSWFLNSKAGHKL